MFFVFTSTTFVYSEFKPTDGTVFASSSDQYVITKKLSGPSGVNLVPVGAIRGVNDVYYLDFTYDVYVKENLQLNVEVSNLSFSNKQITEEELQKIFNFDITLQNVIDDQKNYLGNDTYVHKVITIRVSMNEPDSMELMENIIGGKLTYSLDMSAE
jgi:hypothetical protein